MNGSVARIGVSALLVIALLLGGGPTPVSSDAGESDATPFVWREMGEAIYAHNCAACVFPALAENPFVTGDPVGPTRVLQGGRGGMPPFGDVFTDEQIAAVISFIRNSWGNDAEPVTPDFARAVRTGEHN